MSDRATGDGFRGVSLAILAGLALGSSAKADPWDENPPPMMQWFECSWQDMERRIPDWFLSGWGSVWLPPVSRGYLSPTATNQNSTSAGYDVFDRFHLGKPNARTAYGTEAGFDAVVDEFHRANGLVYVDMVLNHNAGRRGDVQFLQDGGYPGFWQNPPTPIRNMTSTDNWGDFHNGISTGYYQSENPGGARYCLQSGDLVALIDINHASVNNFIRQPTAAGNPLNIPGGSYFNNPDPANARFYPDPALGTDTVTNPGMSFANGLNTGIFTPPCDVPWRNEPASQLTLGRFNTANPGAGVAVAENATGYLLRWVQWMVDVKKVDGFRIDAIKHMPSWFYDTFYDTVVSGRRVTPDGRFVTPYSFGESVEGNDFTFDRYVRKPNGRTTGRLAAGDAYGNRDCLDLNGAGQIRNLIGASGTGSWNNVTGAHLDNVDDGFNNGSVGVNHIFSHDNGSQGSGSSVPPLPTSKQQGWFAHAYLLMRTGQAKVYHNSRLVTRTGTDFYPREGVPLTLGYDPGALAPSPVITNLVKFSNWFGRGEYMPRWQDSEVLIFERRTNTGSGYSGNCLVAVSDRYDGGTDPFTVTTSFPQGTRLFEYTGHATDAVVNSAGDLSATVTVGAGGSVTFRVPRNKNAANVEHHKGFLVYAPAVPAGTLSILGTSGTIAPDSPPTPANVLTTYDRRRLNAIPVVSAATFTIDLVTTNMDALDATNQNADDNAVFRINAGYQDFNGNGVSDLDHQSLVVPGHEQFVTLHQPLYNTGLTQGHYQQVIDATLLPEGMNYVSATAFRKRGALDAPLFREFRAVVYVDRLCAQVSFIPPAPPVLGSQATVTMKALDRTASAVHVLVNPTGTNYVAQANVLNLATRVDRLDWSRVVSGLNAGNNHIVVVTLEDSGRGCFTEHTLFVGQCTADVDDGSGTGTPDGGVTIDDLIYYLGRFEAGDVAADVDDGSGTGTPDGGVTIDDLIYYLTRFEAGC